eukprot:2918868-Pyramimonas_sp.AAC.1
MQFYGPGEDRSRPPTSFRLETPIDLITVNPRNPRDRRVSLYTELHNKPMLEKTLARMGIHHANSHSFPDLLVSSPLQR